MKQACHQSIRDHHDWCNRVNGSAHPLPCMYTNVLFMLRPGSYDPAANFIANKFSIYRSILQQSQFCSTHHRHCMYPHADYDFSGLPCTDNSKAKHHRQFYEGPTGPVFITWAIRLKRYGVKIGVLENTPEFQSH